MKKKQTQMKLCELCYDGTFFYALTEGKYLRLELTHYTDHNELFVQELPQKTFTMTIPK